MGWGCSSVVNYLPRIPEALGSNPSTTKRKPKVLTWVQWPMHIVSATQKAETGFGLQVPDQQSNIVRSYFKKTTTKNPLSSCI